jgi:hypothetical protein
MASTTLTGQGFWVPDTEFLAGGLIHSSANVTLDAANEACHFIGYVSLEGRTGSKTISAAGSGKIHWSTGTSITFANGATNLRIGIQDVTTGVPARGDGTNDVYADLVGGTDTISTDAWMTTTMESGTKDITHGQLVCIALTMTARAGADSVLVRNASVAGQTATTVTQNMPQVTAVTSGPTYTAQTGAPLCLIEFDDGTYGFIDGGLVLVPQGATPLWVGVSFDSDTTPDEYALVLQFPVPVTIDGVSVMLSPAASTSDFEIILYSDAEGTPSVVETLSMDANQAVAANTRRWVIPLTTPRALTANTKYAVAIRPTTTDNVSLAMMDVNVAAHWAAHALGEDAYLGTRTNQTGAFSSTTTRRPMIGVRISALDNGVGGGGMVVHTGMSGGIRG